MASVRSLRLFPWGCVPRFPPESTLGGLTEDGEPTGERLIFDTGSGTYYPFEMPISHAVQMWWRVRHWKLSFEYYYFRTLTTEDPGSYQETPQEAITLTTEDSPPSDAFSAPYLFAEDEMDLACRGGFGDYETAAVQLQWTKEITRNFVITTPPARSGSFQAPLVAAFSVSTQQQGFPPPFCFTASSSEFNGGRIAGSIVHACFELSIGGHSTLRAPGAEPTATAQLKLGFLGKTYSAQMYCQPDANIDEQISSVIMEPIEFWPYNPGDGGGPIYDKTTGSQLRPFSS